MSWVGNHEDAEDLTSCIFLKAMGRVDYERSPMMIRWWLFQVATTTLADHWRERYHLITYPPEECLDVDGEEPTEENPAVEDNSATERIQRLKQALPPHYREVLTCRFLLNLSIRDTARRIGLTVTNVKVIQSRALKRATELESVVSESEWHCSHLRCPVPGLSCERDRSHGPTSRILFVSRVQPHSVCIRVWTHQHFWGYTHGATVCSGRRYAGTEVIVSKECIEQDLSCRRRLLVQTSQTPPSLSRFY